MRTTRNEPRATKRWYWLALAAVALTACDDESLDPAWLVKSFRVLAVVTEPPDALPGETVRIHLVYADRPGASRPVSAFWQVCEGPLVQSTAGQACAAGTPLVGLDPEFTVPVAATSASSWVAVGYACAGGTIAIDPGTHNVQCNGGEGMAFYRTIWRRQPPGNHNPAVAHVLLDGVELGIATPGSVRVCTTARDACPSHTLVVAFAPDARELVSIAQPDGTLLQRPESLISEFIVDGGELDGAFRSDGDADSSARHTNTFKAPATPGDVHLWVLVRDGRGGISATTRALRVEP